MEGTATSSEIQHLAEQVKILAETVNAMTQRQEQVFKMHEEKLSSLEQTVSATALRLQETTEDLETTNRALLDSLSDSDAQVDDLAKITAALLLIQKDMQAPQESESSGG